MYANYHTHTKRCKHADGEDREYIEAAIQMGIRILGFSDHCPWVFPGDYVSGIRMEPSDVEDYFSSLEKLRTEYADDIKILIGFEAEYAPALMEGQEKLLSDYPLDYMILGQHFLGTEPDSIYTGAPTNDENLLCEYVDLVIEGMETGKYLYLAHPDVLNFTGDDAIFRKHMTRLCQYLKEKNYPVELNMLGAFQGRHYPSDKFLRIVQEVGNSCIVGIDAHEPGQIKNEYGFEVCERLIEKYQLKMVDRLNLS